MRRGKRLYSRVNWRFSGTNCHKQTQAGGAVNLTAKAPMRGGLDPLVAATMRALLPQRLESLTVADQKASGVRVRTMLRRAA